MAKKKEQLINIEDKTAFFSQYFGQKVKQFYHADFIQKIGVSYLNKRHIKSSFLLLTPIYKITEKDAKVVSKLLFGNTRKWKGVVATFRILKLSTPSIPAIAHQYLLRNGYAMDFMSKEGKLFTVTKQIQLGWTKLKK